GPHQYETVSGFVCRAFGYIPRTGQSIDIVLEKKNVEETADFGENGVDHHEDQREKYQKYKLEVLAGNARKVGAVRFEEAKYDKVTSAIPHTLKQKREGVYETDDHEVQPNQETSLDMKVTPLILSKNREISDSMQVGSPNRQFIAENVDINDQAKPQMVKFSELTVIYPENVSAVEDTNMHMMRADDIDVPSTRISSEFWTQHEKKGERRKRKRRNQSLEESVDLESEQTVD
ncbi:hypothetical protein KI387_001814, partial [Taxus chinensis]